MRVLRDQELDESSSSSKESNSDDAESYEPASSGSSDESDRSVAVAEEVVSTVNVAIKLEDDMNNEVSI